MVAIGLVMAWLGYQQVIYGWVLLKGWDVTWRELASPINPFQWPGKGSPPAIPAGQILPGGAGTGELGAPGGPNPTVSSSPLAQRVNRAARQAGRPSPGSVPGRL